MSDTWLKLDDRQLAAVLAGLRCLQHQMEGSNPDGEGIDGILTNLGDQEAMSLEEVGDLCESANMGGDELPKPRVLIECSGGITQNVLSDGQVLICVADHDEIDQASDIDPREFHEPDDVVEPAIIDERLKDFNDSLAEAQGKAVATDEPSNCGPETDIGDEILFHGNGGYQGDKDHAAEHLKIGQRYIVASVDVQDWSTSLQLKGLEGQSFNSTLFSHC